jgi:arsenate reductase
VIEKLARTSESLIGEVNLISEERKILLEELGIYIEGKLRSERDVGIVFICTHNSRRSHMAQIWAQTAAFYFGIGHIKTYSGGTQKTAFNLSAVRAIKSAGFKVSIVKEGKNPKYKVQYADKGEPMICFSKMYNHKTIPGEGFVAVMTCSDADEACPVVGGADYRTTINYEDPKQFDGTDQEASAYEERSLQIGREMFYVFGMVSKLLKPQST